MSAAIVRRPVWRRYPVRVRALLTVVEAISDERAMWPADSPVRAALERARDELVVAMRLADRPD